MKWLTRIGGVVLALVAALALVPSFVTLDEYVPMLEKEISARLDEPVSIDRLRASMLPVPRVRVDGIAIGADREVKVGELTVQPDLWSLFGARKVIRRIELEDVTLVTVFTASAPRASQLDEALRIETPFTVRDGVLHGKRDCGSSQ